MAQKHNPESTNAPMTRFGSMGAQQDNKRIVRGHAYIATKWTAENPILQLGEMGYETDTGLLKVGDGVTAWNSLAYISGGNSSSAITVTLASADWASSTQTVTATGVTASNNVIVAPAPASTSDYTSNGVLCTAQGTDSLTFTCTTDPTSDLTVNVIIM